MGDSWTKRDLEIIRRGWLTVPIAELARTLRRAKKTVALKAAALGLPARPRNRPWTSDELDIVRRNYRKVPARQLAARLGRGEHCVHQAGARIGVARKRIPINVLLINWIEERAGGGWCNPCIARAWTAKWPAEYSPLDRHTVGELRDEYEMPPSPGPLCSQCRGSGVAKQRAALGIRHSGDLRGLAYRNFAIANGWPGELRPREVQILNALATQGVPMTTLELAAAIGMRTDRSNANHGHVLLSGNGPGGTYTASLVRSEFLVRHRRATGAQRGCRDLYSLGPRALEILQRRAECPQPMASTAV